MSTITSTTENMNNKFSKLTLKNYNTNLPIYEKKSELIQAIRNNQILILIGNTGCGKTTQVPQYLLETDIYKNGKIGCTQLRRVAAKAAAIRVSEELGCTLGNEVGYIVRFENRTNENTIIQYMTDGILLRECSKDNTLSSYSVIIVDECHERSINVDVLMAVLKDMSKRRQDLKLIISSATLEAEKFSSFFNNAQVFRIDGRTYPVTIEYRSSMYASDLIIWSALDIIKEINKSQEDGDILVFLTGERDIEQLAEMIEDKPDPSSFLFPKLVARPFYSSMPFDEQSEVFEPVMKGQRKVVLATNIAETSLTINGIKFVIDCGFVKQKVYDPKKRIEVLKPVPVSQAQAVQRTGRAGRTGPGKCYRLYSKQMFDEQFKPAPNPEIIRSALIEVVLLLKSMGYNDILQLHFLDPPPVDLIQKSINELVEYDAIDKFGFITETGKKMVGFPLEPNLSKILIISDQLRCTEEILIIVALLSAEKKQKEADRVKKQFKTSDGDLVMMMNVYKLWEQNFGGKDWCKERFLKLKVLLEAKHIRDELKEIMLSKGMKLSSAESVIPIKQSICYGLYKNIAKLVHKNRPSKYKTLDEEYTYLHPGSALFGLRDPEYVVYQKVINTNKPYMLNSTAVDDTLIREIKQKLLL